MKFKIHKGNEYGTKLLSSPQFNIESKVWVRQSTVGCNELKLLFEVCGEGEEFYYQVAIAKAHDSLPGCH